MKFARWATKRKAILCAVMSSALWLQMSGITYAEEAPYSLDQVVVTATKTPVKESEANANITVVTRAEIEKNHYHDLTDILRNVPGIVVSNQDAGIGFERSNTMQINGSSNIVVLIDGLRANVNGSESNVFPASAVSNLDTIERIEIVKGAASALYGADAKGGVINIITRKATDTKTTLTATAGSYNKETYDITHQGKSGDYSWVVSSQKDRVGNFQDAKGNEIVQHRKAETNSLKLTKKLNDASDLTFSYDQYKADEISTDDFYAPLGQRLAGKDDNSNWSLVHNYKFADGSQNQMALYHRSHDTSYEYYDAWQTPNIVPWKVKIKTTGLQDQFTKQIGKKHRITTGFEFYEDKVTYNDGYEVYADKKLTTHSLYLQDEWSMGSKWKLTSGLRQDDHSEYGRHLTPNVNLGYQQNVNTNYYVGYTEFFVAPTQYQIYSGTYGNLNLKPETGHTVEAGVNHKFNDTMTGAFYVFKRQSTNAIRLNSVWKYTNIDEESATGWDVQLNKKWSNKLQSFVGYTHLHIDPIGAGQIENRNGLLPTGTWNIGVNYYQKKYDISLLGRGIINQAGKVNHYFPGNSYWVWDVAANYQVTEQAKVFVKVNNLWNEYYAEVSAGAGQWYASPGRNYQVGIQYQF